MRSTVIAALLAASFSASATDMVARLGKDSVRLTEEPCPVEVIQHVPQGQRGFFRRAFVQINGHEWSACFAARPDGVVIVVYSDGDVGQIPMQIFKQDDGV